MARDVFRDEICVVSDKQLMEHSINYQQWSCSVTFEKRWSSAKSATESASEELLMCFSSLPQFCRGSHLSKQHQHQFLLPHTPLLTTYHSKSFWMLHLHPTPPYLTMFSYFQSARAFWGGCNTSEILTVNFQTQYTLWVAKERK